MARQFAPVSPRLLMASALNNELNNEKGAFNPAQANEAKTGQASQIAYHLMSPGFPAFQSHLP